MVFSSLVFLFVFLPAVLGVYYISPRKYRNSVLLLFSYLFYFWGSGWFLIILIISTAVDYSLGLLIDSSTDRRRRQWVLVSIAFNIAVLGYFKYANFFIAELNMNLLYLFGTAPIGWTKVILPIGISFFTFQKITYIVDVSRGTKRAFKSFVDFALYVAMFPQLIAGPIVRFHEISDQLKQRTETLDGFYHGILRFCLGLTKKVLLANACAEIADAAFIMNVPELGTMSAWIGISAYTLQIYFDFSAYSDMAIGLGQMFGFRLPENFNRPYSALSITDFWRRWHITLSNFFRDYLYIPLGGNRCKPSTVYANLMVVFLLCGLWHGANWTFIAWGLYHGALLMIERITGLKGTEAGAFILLRRATTLLLVMVGWVFFRAPNIRVAIDYLSNMFVPVNLPMPHELYLALHNRNLLFFLLAALVVLLPRDFSAARFLSKDRGPVLNALRSGGAIALLLYSAAFIASGSYNPFIYFQF